MSTISDIAPLHSKYAPELYLKRKNAPYSSPPLTYINGCLDMQSHVKSPIPFLMLNIFVRNIFSQKSVCLYDIPLEINPPTALKVSRVFHNQAPKYIKSSFFRSNCTTSVPSSPVIQVTIYI